MSEGTIIVEQYGTDGGDIIDSIRLSHPPFTIYVPCNE